MKGTIRLRFLGTPQVEQDGEPLHGFRSRKALALLGYLATQGHPVPRAQLAALFWEDLDESRGRANLSWVLHQISSLLPDCLRADRHTVELRRSSSCWLDIDALSALDVVGDASSLKAAADLYRGPFLEGIQLDGCPEFEIWLAGERESWRQRLTDILHALVQDCTQRGEHQSGVRYAQRLLSLEPWRETTHRQMMRMLARCGRWSAALAQYESCRQILATELGVQPMEKTRALYARIRAARTASRQNLPAQPTPFVGRQAERAEVLRLLDNPDCRLLTLLGPGGVGKSRLAIESASARKDAFLEGVRFVPLAQVNSPEFLVSTMAKALRISFSGRTDARAELINYLSGKEVLLLLDSFEHLTTASDLLAEILQEAPEVKLLVTSRASLDLRWEWRYELKGLRYPIDVGFSENDLATYDAVDLFRQVARQVNSRFSISAGNWDALTRICQLVEGVPLAIELAAAEVKTRSCDAILREIEENAGFLATSLQDVPARHRSLRATFEYSWRLLTAEQQRALMKLSVFRQGFEQDAARSVADASSIMLESLRDKSLLRIGSSGRYVMHDLVRQYSRDKLTNAASVCTASLNQHAAHYLALLRRLTSSRGQRETAKARAAIEADIANVRAAWRWAAQQRAVGEIEQSLGSLSRFYLLAGPYQEGEALISLAIDSLRSAKGPGEDGRSLPMGRVRTVLSRLIAERARFLNRQGLYDQAVREARAAIELIAGAREHPCLVPAEAMARLQWGRALVRRGAYTEAEAQLTRALSVSPGLALRDVNVDGLRSLGNVHHAKGDYAGAAACYRQALAIARQLGDRRRESALLANLGLTAHQQGCYGDARAYYQRALELAREIGDRWSESLALINLGYVSDQQGAYHHAEALYRECLHIAQGIGDRQGESMALSCLGLLFHHLGEDEAAAEFSEEAASIAKEIGALRVRGYALTRLGHALLELGRLAAAEAAYRGAIRQRQELGERGRLLESQAGLARTLVARGELDQARSMVERILTDLKSTDLNDTDEPLRIHLTCHRVLCAIEDPRAPSILHEAHSLLQERAAGIDEADLRRSFLEDVPPHREILDAYQSLRASDRPIEDGEEAQIPLPAARTERLPHDQAAGGG